MQGHADRRVQGQKDTKIQGCEGARVGGHKDRRVQGQGGHYIIFDVSTHSEDSNRAVIKFS